MFLEVTLHGYSNAKLPYHMYPSLIEAIAQKAIATVLLHNKLEWGLQD